MNIASQEKTEPLHLSDNDRKITGVCGGIAAHFSWNSDMLRGAWILASALTGILPGIILYWIMSVLMGSKPSDKETLLMTIEEAERRFGPTRD